MLKLAWEDLGHDLLIHLENEEWVQIPYDKKQRILEDLRNPENMETYLRYSPGCDMVNFKIYRPDGLTRMSKFSTWVLIPGTSAKIHQCTRNQKSDGRKSA